MLYTHGTGSLVRLELASVGIAMNPGWTPPNGIYALFKEATLPLPSPPSLNQGTLVMTGYSDGSPTTTPVFSNPATWGRINVSVAALTKYQRGTNGYLVPANSVEGENS